MHQIRAPLEFGQDSCCLIKKKKKSEPLIYHDSSGPTDLFIYHYIYFIKQGPAKSALGKVCPYVLMWVQSSKFKYINHKNRHTDNQSAARRELTDAKSSTTML